MAASSFFQVEKLVGKSNYRQWKQNMEWYLGHEDLYDLVLEEPATGEPGAADRKRDHKARCKIGMLVAPECQMHLIGKETAKQMWDALDSNYRGTGPNTICMLLEKLMSIKLKR